VINQIADAINLVSDATGVGASYSSGTLTLQSTAYGSDAFVNAEVISEGVGGIFENNLSATRDTGTDIEATVNGVAANGDGNTFSINTATLDLSISVTEGSSSAFNFTISGGGALFQLGPDVVSNQQARFGIPNVGAASLKGTSGRLYQLGSGEAAALDTNPTLAAEIVEQVIDKVTSLRGRLGAFQKTTLDTNIASLNDTLENITEAESLIRDADFAVETASLTRAQILVQAGTSVLAIANTSPQNVLSLLR
jgi:flagellin